MKSFYQWLNENKNNKRIIQIQKITPEMEDNFKKYVSGHISKVVSFAKILLDAGKISQELFQRIADTHDTSKLQEPEYTPYVKRKWAERNSNVDLYEKMGDDIKNAIVHHVKNNKHHPEFWSNDYKGFSTTAPCHVNNMPEKYVIEMVCDWEAMALERGNTARSWYDKTKDTRWIFDSKTATLIEKWLNFFEEVEA